MRSRFLAASTATLLVVGVLFALAPAANAAAPKLFVGTNSIGAGTSCAHPGFNSIQAAVTAAAAGSVITVCPGTYKEQVLVDKKLTIKGSGIASTFVQIPDSSGDRTFSTCNPASGGTANQDIIDICGGASTKVKMSLLTVRGPWPGLADCSVGPVGINVADGATLTLNHAAVTGIAQDPLNGCQGGIGIRIGRQATGLVGHATIKTTTVAGYQKGGIVVSNSGSTLTLSKSSIVGVGETNQIAQNGLQVSSGAKAKVTTTTISGNECDVNVCGPDLVNDTQSAGVLLLDVGMGTSIASSTIKNNDMGLYNDETTGMTPSVTTSTLQDNRYGGAVLDEGKITMSSDTVSGSPTGVEVISYNGQGPAPQPTLSQSVIKGASTAAVSLDDDGSVGYPQAVLTLTKVDLSGGGSPNAYGVENNDNSSVKAAQDWWGDVNGPSDWSFGAGVGVSPNVDFFPWATTSAMSSFATCTTTGSANVTAVAFGVYCGTSGSDVIQLNGAAGPTLILGNGGTGGDFLTGADGNDWIIGSPGNDSLNGGLGSNHIQGRGGVDTCSNPASGPQTNGC